MTGENGLPECPDWSLPPRDVEDELTIPALVELGEN